MTAFLALELAGCAAPQTVFRPVEVDVPVVTPCATAPIAVPDFALAHATSDDSLFDKTKAALIEIDQRRAYEAEMQAQLAACR